MNFFVTIIVCKCILPPRYFVVNRFFREIFWEWLQSCFLKRFWKIGILEKTQFSTSYGFQDCVDKFCSQIQIHWRIH
jgi:hypothetical protein